ncbi:MAG: hypothetical protein ACI8V5_003602 [Limisphaerales bacterium]|jgi:hypothetical protein
MCGDEFSIPAIYGRILGESSNQIPAAFRSESAVLVGILKLESLRIDSLRLIAEGRADVSRYFTRQDA